MGTLLRRVKEFGAFIEFFGRCIGLIFQRPFRLSLVFQQMEFFGNGSLPIIIITGFATGSIFGLQTGEVFRIFQAESMIGGATGIALATELGPLITGFLLSGRAGSAITAEIATMVVNEQIDALEVMAVDPEHYLAVPRLLAAVLMMPLLCAIFMFVGEFGAYVVGITIYKVDTGIFFDKLLLLLETEHLIKGLRKMLIFSVIITTVASYFGLRASGGAKGVGSATTNAVITMLISILFVDFLISYAELKWLD